MMLIPSQIWGTWAENFLPLSVLETRKTLRSLMVFGPVVGKATPLPVSQLLDGTEEKGSVIPHSRRSSNDVVLALILIAVMSVSTAKQMQTTRDVAKPSTNQHSACRRLTN